MVRKHNYASRGEPARAVYPMAARIRAEAGVTRLDIFDEIGADPLFGGGVSAKSLSEQLAEVRGPLEVHISSAGGDVFDGLAVYNALKSHQGPVTTVVDGLAASIASVIMQAGSVRVMAPGSMAMVHDAWAGGGGNEDEHRQMAGVLGKVSDNLASVYAARCGGTPEHWRDIMRAETWYTAEEAVAAGLADRVGGSAAKLPEGLDIAALGPVPGRIAAALRSLPQEGRAALRAVPDAGAPLAHPSAGLDRFPWAKSFGAFLAAIRDEKDRQGARAVIRDVRNAAGMSERVPSDGGFLLPWGLQERILALMTTAIVRPRAMHVPVAGLREAVPFLENYDQSTPGAALGGVQFSIIKEGATFTATNPQFGRTVLEVSKVGAYIKDVPNELFQDSPAFTEVFLPTIIARGLAFFEDSLFITDGTGVGQPQSLLNSPGALPVTRANSGQAPVHADIIGLMKSMHPAGWPDAAWLLSASAFNALLELYEVIGTAPTGQDITPSRALEYDMDHKCWRLMGLPALPNDFQAAAGSAGDVMLCNLGRYLVGDKGAMSVEVSSKGSGFASGTSNIRIRHRMDGRFWPQSTYTTRTGQGVSELCVLQ